MKDTTNEKGIHPLIEAVLTLLAAHRAAFRQERTYQRSVGLLFGEIFNFARHTVTQGLLALGITEGDWSAWYRLFSQKRFEEEKLANCLLEQTVQHVAESEPYVVAMDGTAIHRSSLKMPGTSWLRDSRFSAFRPGIHRAQRFLHGAWLTPRQEGFSRAIPLRFLPAYPQKANPAETPNRREWEAGLVFLNWLRRGLDRLGRKMQMVLVLADGGFDVLELWQGLPENVVMLTRTARNRALFELPTRDPHPGRGRPASYGDPAPKPAEWLHRGLRNWPKRQVAVRGKSIEMRFQVLGPFLRDGLPDRPLFLIVVKGMHRKVGKRKVHFKHRGPSFYLVSAVKRNGRWQLPLPIATLLAWLWQRWEIEVAHRELKTGWGVGEKQCWTPRSAEVSVQWSVWVYALLLLAGYRTWGLLGGPPTPAAWWPGAKRWSLSTLWRAYRAALWGTAEFRALWNGTGDNWWQKDTWLAGLANAIPAASRI